MTSVNDVDSIDQSQEISLMAKVDHELTLLPEVKEGSSNKIMPEFVSEP